MKIAPIVSVCAMLLLAGLPWPDAAYAAGKVSHLSGTLSVLKPDGSVKILSQKSEVVEGDTLSTEKDSYAQVNFNDGSTMTLRPLSRMKIENFKFDQERPQQDNAFFRLLKGGLRTVTGLIGKRGNMDSWKMGTSTATIGIRGSSGDTLDCTAGCAGVINNGEQLESAVYHATHSGAFVMSNQGGERIVAEGQFGLSRNINVQPAIIPQPSAIDLHGGLPFSLPGGGAGGGGDQQIGGERRECVVR